MDKIKKTFAMAGVIALLAPAAAFAQASNEAYGGDGDVVAGLESGSGDDGGNASPAATTTEGDNLPFTGSDLGVLAAAGGALLGMGFGLRRMTHRPTEA
jgi:hypothetical protein